MSGPKSLLSLFRWSLKKNTANGREARRYDGVQVCLLSYLSKVYSFSLKQNISNICQSIFVFLSVYYDKIFKHLLEFSSIRLRVSFLIAFVHKCTQFKMLKDKVNIPVLKVDRRLVTFSEVTRFRAPKRAFSLKLCSV